ncbi:glycoside hydrolase family protein [bacterium]|jgi:lysozyme|nr:glycoside hydrolase family protein [bacterium]
MNYNRQELIEQLKDHEGLELKVYKCTAGIETIGIGRNLVDRGVTEEEAYYLCNNDVDIVERELVAEFPIVADLDGIRQRVVIDMAFNVGVPRLTGFKKMWAALHCGDYAEAAKEMMDSKWARQVGRRAERLSSMMETGAE